MPVRSTRDSIGVAATPRYRASQRRRILSGAKQAMILAIGVAVLSGAWHVAFRPDAAALILGLNGAIGVVAAVGFLSLGTVARRRPEVVVFGVLVVVDAAVIIMGLGHADLGFEAVSYLLLLPIVVPLVISWATKVHVAWLGLHAALAFGYALLAPTTSIPAGARDQLVGVLIVALAVSLSGHHNVLRARVSSFELIERIKALNRQARRDQADLQALNEVLATTAATDALTGLGNRLALDEGLRLARSRIERQGERYGLMILDLDRFKAINDERGHLAGDDVLAAVSGSLRGVLRAGDSAYRYGGEEFVALIVLTGPDEALAAAERIRTAIEDLQIPNERNTPYGHLTTSVGVIAIGQGDHAADDATWLARADAALFRAKANGRNRSIAGSSSCHRPGQVSRGA